MTRMAWHHICCPKWKPLSSLVPSKVLPRMHLHVKVSGWLSDLKALLTRKFLPLLNELNGGRENICLVSGSLWGILRIFWMVGDGEYNSLGFFFL